MWNLVEDMLKWFIWGIYFSLPFRSSSSAVDNGSVPLLSASYTDGFSGVIHDLLDFHGAEMEMGEIIRC